MNYKGTQFLEIDGFLVAASAEGENSEEQPIYYPFNALCIIEQGNFHLKVDGQRRVIPKNNFREFAILGKAELSKFMAHHITDNIPLDQLARLSGRSLSTFNREFKKWYRTSPHQWIKKERLKMARRILEENDQRPSDIYLEVGFEDLAHFSNSFKKYFGINPSEVGQGNH